MKKYNPIPSSVYPFEQLSGLDPRTPMLIALSGGADSRMLFELASRHCSIHGSRFFACHVNHGIRGDEAISDRDFCKALAESCPQCEDIFILNADVPALARSSGRSIEHEARNVRYEFFERVMKERNIPILVTAHNADDNLETLIFNLTRGSGPRGMCGIPKRRPFGGGILIRPMLAIAKSEVLQFCHENGLVYVTDRTNEDQDYTRNLIRAQIVPNLERINPAVRQAASRLSDSMTELWSHSSGEAGRFLLPDRGISLSRLKKAPLPIRSTAIALSAEASGIDLGSVHLTALTELCEEGRDSASLSLPDGKRAVLYGDRLCFEHDARTASKDTPFELALSEGSLTPSPKCRIETNVKDGGLEISISLFPNCEKCVNNINVYKLDIRAHIIFDKINESDLLGGRLRLRSRLPGDKILSGGHHKSVKKLMCDRGLPVAARDILPMLCLDGEIVWIPSVASGDLIKCRYFDEMR